MTWKWGLGLGAVAVTSSVAAFMLGRRRAARGRVWWVESLGPGRGLYVQVDDEGDPAHEARRAREFAEDLIKLGVWESGGEFSSWPIQSAAGGWSHQIREATHSERRT